MPEVKQLTVFSAYPKRDTLIDKEDIINLQIALGLSNSFDKFLEFIQTM